SPNKLPPSSNTLPPAHTHTHTEPQPPPQVRWSLTQRLFNFSPLRPAPTALGQPARAPASRLWNPINSSPRPLAVPSHPSESLPNVPVDHQPSTGTSGERDGYPLLSLIEQYQSKLPHNGPQSSSLRVEWGSAGDSSRTSARLPGNKRRNAARAAGLSHAPSADHPTAISAGPDAEAGLRLTRTASRATIPADQQTGTFRSRQHSNLAQDDEEPEEEYPWGPSHPCFPHLNPHVPLSSPLYDSTRIIRVKRDWMLVGDLAPTFANLYPEVLDPYISEDEFRDVIKKLNTELVAAFSPWSARAAFDAVMGVATLWLWEDLGLTGVKKRLRRLEEWMEEWNRLKGAKEGVRIIPLRRTGYMSLDIQIPDPQIGLDSAASIHSTRPASAYLQPSAVGGDMSAPVSPGSPGKPCDDGLAQLPGITV
ncbi:Golgin subfamily A member 7/ERF4 family-domain-containing protein, partial [Phyllosticta citriasiana]